MTAPAAGHYSARMRDLTLNHILPLQRAKAAAILLCLLFVAGNVLASVEHAHVGGSAADTSCNVCVLSAGSAAVARAPSAPEWARIDSAFFPASFEAFYPQRLPSANSSRAPPSSIS